ncbi:MAG: glycosyltransferase family 4 protein [Rhodothalassiaceae bacterium]
MHILYHHRILAADGMQVHISELTASLRGLGHELVMVGPEAGGDGRSGLTGRIGALRSHMPAALSEALEIGYNLKAAGQLRGAIRLRRPDVIYERYNAFLTAGVSVARAFDLPLIMEVNAPLAEERKALGNLALERMARRMERRVWRAAEAVLPVSDALADHVRAAGVPEERIHVIPNGVRRERFDGVRSLPTRRELGLSDRIVFGFVGFVRPWHGLDRVLTAFSRIGDPRLHLLIVGEGPASADLRRLAEELGIAAQLSFTGTRPHDEIPRLLGAVDVALQPDATPYASPLKLFEYLAAGCAVIAPDQPNIRELVRDGEDALLFDRTREGALESAIERLARDADLRERLGAAAIRTVAERDYSWDGNARRVIAIAGDILARRGRDRDGGSR